MSSHFNYEIDEKSLGSKLKQMRVQYSESAWTRFEQYSEGQKKTYSAPVLPRVRLNINRNVILPAVFGSVIILFSMLLYNFISIRKPAEIAAVNKTPSVAIPLKNEITAPAKKIEPAVVAVDSSALKAEEKKDSVAAPVEAKAEPAPTIAAIPEVKQAELPGWTVIENGEIYKDPNIKSQVIGNSHRNQSFKAIEETVYFIKTTFTRNGKTDTGYVRKSHLLKPGQTTHVVHRKARKAEVLESIQVPASLPTAGSSEKEPELK